MNAITRYFRADSAPPVAFVNEVYTRTFRAATILSGLKRFLVDYYVWACLPNGNETLPRICRVTRTTASQVPPLYAYPQPFIQHVTTTLSDISAKVVIDPKDPRQRTESKDAVVDFVNLEAFLCNARQGRLKCRYHQHTSQGLCFNLIVDSAPVTATLEQNRQTLQNVKDLHIQRRQMVNGS